MLENPWSAVVNPTSALGPSSSSFSPSSLAPVGIHHPLLSNLTTACGQLWDVSYTSVFSHYYADNVALPAFARAPHVGRYLLPTGPTAANLLSDRRTPYRYNSTYMYYSGSANNDDCDGRDRHKRTQNVRFLLCYVDERSLFSRSTGWRVFLWEWLQPTETAGADI